MGREEIVFAKLIRVTALFGIYQEHRSPRLAQKSHIFKAFPKNGL